MGRAELMGATELEEVQSLLEHVLPDPAGYAQRLALQAMTRWGQSAEPNGRAFYPAAAQEDVTVADIVVTPGQPGQEEVPVDINILLAAALGACECWGLRADCELCRGYGSAGWTEPDPELFEEFVRPAVARLPDVSGNGHEQDGGIKADQNGHHHHTVQGANP
jgi:hypothetical protein